MFRIGAVPRQHRRPHQLFFCKTFHAQLISNHFVMKYHTLCGGGGATKKKPLIMCFHLSKKATISRWSKRKNACVRCARCIKSIKFERFFLLRCAHCNIAQIKYGPCAHLCDDVWINHIQFPRSPSFIDLRRAMDALNKISHVACACIK